MAIPVPFGLGQSIEAYGGAARLAMGVSLDVIPPTLTKPLQDESPETNGGSWLGFNSMTKVASPRIRGSNEARLIALSTRPSPYKAGQCRYGRQHEYDRLNSTIAVPAAGKATVSSRSSDRSAESSASRLSHVSRPM